MNAEPQIKIFTQRRYIFLLLSVFCLLCYLPGITALPPFDRDEARFVQASKQMLETGNFIDIRFQEKPRHKKPVGIYWLQASAVAMLADGDLKALWAYRLPSLLSALAGVLLLFFFGEKIFSRKTGALAGLLLASSILLTTEAHLAKTDAALFLCTVISQGALGIIYLKKEKKLFAYTLMFWLGLAAGIMIKGPILPAISILTMAALLITDRDRTWLRKLNFKMGIPMVCLVVLPWLIAIYFITDGAFFTASIGNDMLAKVATGQESHGAWPGYYLLLATVTLFPASLFMFPGFFAAVKRRKDPAIRFCLAWIIPAWLMFELVPTKLMHYVLPLYPAITLLIAEAILAPGAEKNFTAKPAWSQYGLWTLTGLILSGIAIYAPWTFGNGVDIFSISGSLAALLIIALGLFFLFKKSWVRATLAVSLIMVLVYGLLFQFVIPGLEKIWLSPRIATEVNKLQNNGDRNNNPVVIAGFDEPSVVFLLGTDTKFARGEDAARRLLSQQDKKVVAVIEKREQTAFADAFKDAARPMPQPVSEVSGLNYSNGDWKKLRIYALPE